MPDQTSHNSENHIKVRGALATCKKEFAISVIQLKMFSRAALRDVKLVRRFDLLKMKPGS